MTASLLTRRRAVMQQSVRDTAEGSECDDDTLAINPETCDRRINAGLDAGHIHGREWKLQKAVGECAMTK